MSIAILGEQIYKDGVPYETPQLSDSGIKFVLGGLNYDGARYVVMYTCHTDKAINRLEFTARHAGKDATAENKYLGMYVSTKARDDHLVSSIGGETFLRFGYACTNRGGFTWTGDSTYVYAVGAVEKIIPAGTFYVYIVPGVDDLTTYSSWYSKDSEDFPVTFTSIETGGNENLESRLVFVEDNEMIFYREGVPGVSHIAGNDVITVTTNQQKVVSRVVRHQFVTSVTGANKLTVKFYFSGLYNPSSPAYYVPLRFFVGTDPNSHENANSTYAYTGELTMLGDYATLVGNAEMILLPNTTYYVWVFPAADERFSCYQWVSSKDSYIELFGAAGLIYIDNGIAYEPYQFFVDDGEKWEPYILYLDIGEEWLI